MAYTPPTPMQTNAQAPIGAPRADHRPADARQPRTTDATQTMNCQDKDGTTQRFKMALPSDQSQTPSQ